jgi:hypothetical protein
MIEDLETEKLQKFRKITNLLLIDGTTTSKNNKVRDEQIEQLRSILISIPYSSQRFYCFKCFVENYKFINNSSMAFLSKQVEELAILSISASTEKSFVLLCEKLTELFQANQITGFQVEDNEVLIIFLKKLVDILNSKLPIYSTKVIFEFLLCIHPASFNRSIQCKVIKLIHTKFNLLWSKISYKKENEKIVDDSKSLHGNCDVSIDHRIDYYNTSLSQFLFLYAHILRDKNLKNVLKMPKTLYQSLLTLTGSHNFEVSWSACSVLLEYNKAYEMRNFNKMIFPVILRLIHKELDSLGKYKNIFSKYNAPLELLPISLLVKILKDSQDLTTLLNDVNYINYIDACIKNSYDSTSKYMNRFDSYRYSMYLTVLSFLGTLNDKAKINISNGHADTLMINSLSKHVYILERIENMDLTFENLKALEISNQITFASCVLLRSLSRSATLLRTFFTDNKFISLLLKILNFNTTILKDVDPNKDLTYINENSLQTLILGIMSNLIIEFSASRNNLDTLELLKLIKNFLEKSEYDETIVAALSLIRNALFGDDTQFKEEFENVISIHKIFQLCDDPNIDVQRQSFNIIRNLLTDTYMDGDYVYDAYEDYKSSKTDNFVEFLRRHLESSCDTQLTLSICYNLVHLAASTVQNKVSILKNKKLLENLLDLLNTPILKKINSDIDWEVKTCIAWIIIDLTYREEGVQDSSRFEDMNDLLLFDASNRSNILLNYGFHDAFKKMAAGCPSMDFVERASRAIFQLLVSTGSS